MSDHGEPIINLCNETSPSVLVIEPFYGGSHKQLVDLLTSEISGCETHCLPAKKWHWRMRTSALYFSQNIPKKHSYKVLFASSVLNLAELVALRQDLAQLKKVLYFHENQLIYPVQKQQERDFQYGYNQILSCLVADVVAFNSIFNMESFLSSINTFFKLMPDCRPKVVDQAIRPKCRVVYFPLFQAESLDLLPGGKGLIIHGKESDIPGDETEMEKNSKHQTERTSVQHDDCSQCSPLHIVWAHRWEHDKDPELFFHTLYHLVDQGLEFNASVIGQTFPDVPGIFEDAKKRLGDHIIHWGYQQSRKDYEAVLQSADVAVSTAKHEFFGVSMLEAVQHQCYPLCPNKLVYPEIFPAEYLYSTPQQLAKKLRYFCKNPNYVRMHRVMVDWRKFSWEHLKESFSGPLLP